MSKKPGRSLTRRFLSLLGILFLLWAAAFAGLAFNDVVGPRGDFRIVEIAYDPSDTLRVGKIRKRVGRLPRLPLGKSKRRRLVEFVQKRFRRIERAQRRGRLRLERRGSL